MFATTIAEPLPNQRGYGPSKHRARGFCYRGHRNSQSLQELESLLRSIKPVLSIPEQEWHEDDPVGFEPSRPPPLPAGSVNMLIANLSPGGKIHRCRTVRKIRKMHSTPGIGENTVPGGDNTLFRWIPGDYEGRGSCGIYVCLMSLEV